MTYNLPALPGNTPAPITADGARVRFHTGPLHSAVVDIPTGVSLIYALREMFRLYGISRRYLRKEWSRIIITQGEFGAPNEVPYREWGSFLIRPGMRIQVVPIVRKGGKSGLGAILSIVVMVAAAAATWYLGGAGGALVAAGWSVGAANFAAGMASLGIMMAGTLAVNMICPPATAKLTAAGGSAEQSWSVSGTQNRASLYEIIPWTLGKIRFAPRYLANPYTLLKGSDQYLRCLLGVAGRNKVSDVRIGDTAIGSYQGVKLNKYENWQGEAFEFFPSAVFQEDLSVSLSFTSWSSRGGVTTGTSGWNTRTTTDDTVEIQWELFYQSGLMVILPDGRKMGINITFEAGYRLVGATNWTSYGTFTSEWANTSTPFRRGYSLKVPKGRYEFRIRRVQMNYHDKANYNDKGTWIDTVLWSVIRSVQTGPVLVYDGAPLTVFELEIKATDQLNGAVSEFNAEFESYAPVWNGTKWADAPTNNPASLGMLMAVSPHVRRAVPADALDFVDLDAWQGFYQWCADYGWTYDSVVTSQESVREVLHNILASARAALAFRNNLFSVVWDHANKEVVYPFGPRNSWGFTFIKSFVKEQPHGLRVRFLNVTRDFQEDEKVVYADGYNKTNATNIVEAEFDGVTDPDTIYKLGRLRLADSIWRPATYEISTDFAFMAVQKGDRVAVTHDVPMWGIAQARVVGMEFVPYDFEDMDRTELVQIALTRKDDIDGRATQSAYMAMLDGMDRDAIADMLEARKIRDTSRAQGVSIDDYVSMDGESLYALKRYSASGMGDVFSVRSEQITTSLLYFEADIPASSAPGFGDIIHFGLASRETHDCIVTAVEPQESMTAKITMQDYSVSQIYAALTGPIPPWDSDITIPSRWQLSKPATPTLMSVVTDESVLSMLANGSLIPRIQAAFSVIERQGIEIDRVRIQVRRTDSGEMWTDAGSAPVSSGFVYAEGVEEGIEYDVRLYALSTDGIASDFSSIYTGIVVIGRTTPPPAPLRINIDGSRIWWEMPEIVPIDVRGWEVWMSWDVSNEFIYAHRISKPISTVTEFDLSSWGEWIQRVWVRTIDDIGLTSDPVSIAINIGGIIEDNIVEIILEGIERRWPGAITNGAYYEDIGLLPNALNAFWDRASFWGVNAFWGIADTLSMTYKTNMMLTEEVADSRFYLTVDMPYGTLASIEYCFLATEGSQATRFWQYDAPWQADLPWQMGAMDTVETGWTPMPDSLWIDSTAIGRILAIRITTAEGSVGLIQEVEWIFDVEDENENINNLTVPATGIRAPLAKTYRRIKNIVFGLEYRTDGAADQALWADKGIIEDGLVIEGPLVHCLDKGGNPVSGIVDIRIQGVKGAPTI